MHVASQNRLLQMQETANDDKEQVQPFSSVVDIALGNIRLGWAIYKYCKIIFYILAPD